MNNFRDKDWIKPQKYEENMRAFNKCILYAPVIAVGAADLFQTVSAISNADKLADVAL